MSPSTKTSLTISARQDLATAEASAAGKVTLHGYLNNQRNASSKLLFVELTSPDGLHSVQLKLFSSSPEGVALRDTLKLVRPYAPVAITGVVESRTAGSTKSKIDDDAPIKLTNIEINIEHLQPLNDFPKDIIVAEGTVIPPEQRHLQLRTTKALREAIIFRSRACELIRSHLSSKHGFTDIETPLLFKSTPEGAHEFLVPTRNPGHAYALPQSPQQYKQILMASGIPRYVQIAKCFRDEDLRADRQPEFTQIDLEMAFAGEEQVMVMIEDLVKTMWTELIGVDLWQSPFPRMTYEEAMSTYGSDKPDTRLGAPISRIDYMIPIDLIRKITSILDPAVDVFKLSISDDPEITRSFVNTFMSSPNARPFNANPDGQPGIFIYDSRKPLGGLQPFGFEAVEHLETQLELEEGDLIVLQARPSAPFAGGATATGNLRLALHRAAVAANHLPKPMGWSFLWITDFPLFTPADAPEAPSSSSTPAAPAHQASLNVTPTEALTDHPVLESTHHPFTAPKPDSAHLLLSSPLDVKAAHYDLVLNGVELGGGSRRIHKADMQRLVLEKVLRLPPARVAEFEHLLGVLRAGCPPHAGMALGLDRVLMLMLGRESIRDVVAFPKGGGGWDGLVCAPSKVTKEAWERYHLAPVAEKDK
ncbi:hypothetical protein K461DRAFT_267876 [Myriangium duriaei CBS 260.36]|uniref:Aminoacyl-transfer RNA synthetases class-II family profile domain-containing protein n=1 Tax=Myriangium duriaei CBS 260.36 TaxID=1168546 RepID=A0A9P4J4G1_9PEZI|nr:hypothetical protein K461DRAFT_267876 [Myriangium duriaei CBS 260.36]